jgi:hypothetical protein
MLRGAAGCVNPADALPFVKSDLPHCRLDTVNAGVILVPYKIQMCGVNNGANFWAQES